jgi:DNA-binding phage protein
VKIPSSNLLRAIHPKHNPTQETMKRLLQPFGLKLSVNLIEAKSRKSAA